MDFENCIENSPGTTRRERATTARGRRVEAWDETIANDRKKELGW